MATAAAAIHFSCGATAKHQVMVKVGLEVDGNTVPGSARRDKERINQAKRKSSESYKKYRIVRKQARQKEDELRKKKEEITYEAGGFNELSVTSTTEKSSKKRKKK